MGLKPCYLLEVYHCPENGESDPIKKRKNDILLMRQMYPNLKFHYSRSKSSKGVLTVWGHYFFIYKHPVSLWLYKLCYNQVTPVDKYKFTKWGWVLKGLLYGYPLEAVQSSYDKNFGPCGLYKNEKMEGESTPLVIN